MNKRLHNNKILFERRKELRNSPTSQEEILWQHLKNKKLGEKFRRQHSIGPYVVDFYCFNKKLIIELDGNSHAEKDTKEYDKIRSEFLNNLGYTILRFWNSEVDNNLEGVLRKINSTTPSPLLD